jgi:hypothetical protein
MVQGTRYKERRKPNKGKVQGIRSRVQGKRETNCLDPET